MAPSEAALWSLYRDYKPRSMALERVEATTIEVMLPSLVPLFRGSGGVVGCESHSVRSAWIYAPWQDRSGSYPGYEYKGVGNIDGSEVEVVDSGAHVVLYGAQRFDWAQEEYETTKEVVSAGILAQRPLALFRIALRGVEVPAGIFVRSARSPFRLMDFWYRPQLLDTYLELRREPRERYVSRLAATLAASVKALFAMGYGKPLVIDNISSEGELMDFEHVWNGWFYGHPLPICYAYETVYSVFRELPLCLGGAYSHFERTFAASFGAAELPGRAHEKALQLTEAIVGRKLDAVEVVAPVADGVRADLLRRWSAALEWYRTLQALPREGRDALTGPGDRAGYLFGSLDMLIESTQRDIALMVRRPRKVVGEDGRPSVRMPS